MTRTHLTEHVRAVWKSDRRKSNKKSVTGAPGHTEVGLLARLGKAQEDGWICQETLGVLHGHVLLRSPLWQVWHDRTTGKRSTREQSTEADAVRMLLKTGTELAHLY